jgi:heme-degrading monooxygenase HmoA
MFTATFIFAPGRYDDEFHALDVSIAEAARALPGYLGEETWHDPATGRVSNVYWWDSLEAVQALSTLPQHLEAKAAQARWLEGYRVVISQVLRTYGDGRLPSVPPAPGGHDALVSA